MSSSISDGRFRCEKLFFWQQDFWFLQPARGRRNPRVIVMTSIAGAGVKIAKAGIATGTGGAAR